jgi:hypothetical protein
MLSRGECGREIYLTLLSLATGGVDEPPFFFVSVAVDGDTVVGRPGPGAPPGRLRARPPVVPWRENYVGTFACLRGAVAPPLAPLAPPGIRR